MQIVHISLDSVDSTMLYAKRHTPEFDPRVLTCITAEEQTAGKGRFQRTWVSPKGVNLYVTFFFRLSARVPDLSCLSHVAAISLVRTLLHLDPLRCVNFRGPQSDSKLSPQIKWPNDLLLNKKKVAGVLCETFLSHFELEVILGIGLNVNMTPESLACIDTPATSLFVETGHLWDRDKLLQEMQKQWLLDLEQFKKSGFSTFYSQMNELFAWTGKKIQLEEKNQIYSGICRGIAPDGRLDLEIEGTHHLFSGGNLSVHRS